MTRKKSRGTNNRPRLLDSGSSPSTKRSPLGARLQIRHRELTFFLYTEVRCPSVDSCTPLDAAPRYWKFLQRIGGNVISRLSVILPYILLTAGTMRAADQTLVGAGN